MKSFNDYKGEMITAWNLEYDGQDAGRVLVKLMPSGACRALVQISMPGNDKPFLSAHSIASGYGYDKASSAVSDAVYKMGLGTPMNLYSPLSAWTFHNPGESDYIKESRKLMAEKLEEMKSRKEVDFIPTYGGTGMNAIMSAFIAVGFKVHKAL